MSYRIPKPFVEHNGVKVYHCYYVTDKGTEPARFCYSLNPLDLDPQHGYHVLILAKILSMCLPTTITSERYSRKYHRTVLRVLCAVGAVERESYLSSIRTLMEAMPRYERDAAI